MEMGNEDEKSSAKSKKLTDYQDLLHETLSHLPTKTLMRFKGISNLWYLIIRNPTFAKDHSRRGGCFRGIVNADFPVAHNSRHPTFPKDHSRRGGYFRGIFVADFLVAYNSRPPGIANWSPEDAVAVFSKYNSFDPSNSKDTFLIAIRRRCIDDPPSRVYAQSEYLSMKVTQLLEILIPIQDSQNLVDIIIGVKPKVIIISQPKSIRHQTSNIRSYPPP
ncbi:hypothetical protein LIER_22152 [Lithospermum erythrorhizon]|uniref:F-box domain-containing protein n=1 Tax=Lithospermum erythrorhizon TaxID=34254 RepID=A0AAV3QSZ4_LITER